MTLESYIKYKIMVNRVDLPIDISAGHVITKFHKNDIFIFFKKIVIHRTFSRKIYLKYFLGKMSGHNSYAMHFFLLF